jgi:membrane protease subunit HflK
MGGGHHHPHSHPHGHSRPVSWRAVFVTALLLAAAIWASTGVYIVRTGEQAVVRRFGRALERVRTPDLYFGLPAGLDRVTRVKTRQTKRVGVGMALTDEAMGRSAEPRLSECLTGDTNLIVVGAVVQYSISDAKAHSFRVADVPALVRSVAASELSRLIAGMNVDDVLTTGRPAIQTEVRAAAQAVLDRYGAGVRITSVSLASRGVAPPREVADAFRDVTSARGDKQRAINVAEAYANRLAPQARGEAYQMLAEADAYASEVVRKAGGEAERFRTEAAQLKTQRRLTLRRLVLETLERIGSRPRKIVLDAKAREVVDLGLIEGDP